jgi:hypothetical protein
MQNLIGQLLRFVIKLILTVFGLVFAISLLMAALIVVVLSLLKSVVTGKKPAPVVVFRKFQKFAPGAMWPGAAKAQNASDVVDVEVREVQVNDEPLKSEQLPR